MKEGLNRNELLAMPQVKLLGSKPVKARKTPLGALLDLLRCENGAFLVIETRADGSVFNYSTYFTEAEAALDVERDARGPTLPPDIDALLFGDRPLPELAAAPESKGAELAELLVLPELKALASRTVSKRSGQRLDLLRCEQAGVFLVVESTAGHILQCARYIGEADARHDFETNFAAPKLPDAVAAKLPDCGCYIQRISAKGNTLGAKIAL